MLLGGVLGTGVLAGGLLLLWPESLRVAPPAPVLAQAAPVAPAASTTAIQPPQVAVSPAEAPVAPALSPSVKETTPEAPDFEEPQSLSRTSVRQPPPSSTPEQRNAVRPVSSAPALPRAAQNKKAQAAELSSPPVIHPELEMTGQTRNARLEAALENRGSDPAGTIRDLQMLVSEEPRFASARVQLALLLWQKARQDEALQALREGRQLFPDNADITILLARLLAELQQNREAFDLLRQMRAPVSNPGYYGLLGALARQQGQLDLANKAYRQALRLNPDNLQWQMGLGLVLADQGQSAEARVLLQRVLERLPAGSEVGEYLRGRLAGLG